jgi:tRNA (guanine37-N1)-methyltransferase
VDSVARLLPGVLGNDMSAIEESHSEEGYLEYPQYSKPEEFEGWKVPEVLLSGNHANIEKWRKSKAKQK